MKKLRTQILALFLAVLMIFSIPTTALAISPSLDEDRTWNSIQFNTSFKWPGRWYLVPFDNASRAVMFCVDPEVAPALSLADYTVYIGNGGGKLEDVMNLALRDSHLGSLDDGKLSSVAAARKSVAATKASAVNQPATLQVLSDSALERAIQYMSVLHYYASIGSTPSGDGGSYGEKYNYYDVFAVQDFLWYLMNPNRHSMWESVSTPASEKAKVQAHFQVIQQKAEELYGQGTASKITLEGGQSLKGTKTAAEKSPVIFNDADTQDFIVESNSITDYEKIQYISLDGTTVHRFKVGDTVTSGNFSITNNGNGFTVTIEGDPDGTVYTPQFLTSDKIQEAGMSDTSDDESWAIYAQAPSVFQSFFTAYQAPNQAANFMSFIKATDTTEKPYFPEFEFFQHKLDAVPGYDGDTSGSAQCTPVGDTKLDATFTLTYETDLGLSGSVSDTADLYGHGASEVIVPWGQRWGDVDPQVTETKTTDIWVPEDDPEAEGIEFISAYDWTGTCTVTITETGAPEGHHGTSQSYTHTISYRAHTERESPFEAFKPNEYTITIDGVDSGLKSDADVQATWDNPYKVNESNPDTFTNEHWDGYLQIVKTKDSDDIFSEENGEGTTSGGVVPGKDYSKDSKWTIRLVDKNIYDVMTPDDAAQYLEFIGYEDSPYIEDVEDPEAQAGPMGKFAHCYKVDVYGNGTPADENNPLTLGDFGQIYISGIPYGTYLVTEIKADGDRYVKESMYFTISEDEQVISTDIHNTTKENVVKIVKVDSETGKTVPSANTAFRIRYMGSPEYDDPTQTPNYGKYLPNATNINASVTDPNDYIFFTDEAGEVTIPYALPYGDYQVEEILVPEGYYIGSYDEDGVADSSDGTSDSYGPDGDNPVHNEAEDGMVFTDRVAIYDKDGNKIDYTKDENVVYNYYKFSVTEQDDHLDGTDYQTYYLTVELSNTASKGKIEIAKMGEKLVGFKEVNDEHGNVVSEPIYENFPLADATFGIYAAEDILLEDGEEPPVAYDKLTGDEIELVTDVLNHVQYPDSQIIQSGKHEATGAEVIYRTERSQANNGESNMAYVDYLTPVQKGTTYTLQFSRYDEEAGLTYDYDIEFGLEYTAGGWNYTDINVTRTITADDYTPSIPDDMPKIFNGDQEIDYTVSQTFANKNKIEVFANDVDGEVGVHNAYDMSANDFTIQGVDTTNVLYLAPVIPQAEKADRLIGVPEIPDGYKVDSITPSYVTITTGVVGSEMIAAMVPDLDAEIKESEEPPLVAKWIPMDEMNTTEGFEAIVPKFSMDVSEIKGVDGEPLDFTAYGIEEEVHVAYATSNSIQVTLGEDEENIYTIYYTGMQSADGTLTQLDTIELWPLGETPSTGSFDGPDPSDYPLPEGYHIHEGAMGVILAINDETQEYMTFVKIGDGDDATYRWIHSDIEGNAYKVRKQSFNVTLTQHNTSTDGWRFEMDGIILTNSATDEDTATAKITVPYENAEPVVSDYVGCDVNTVDLEAGGKETTVIVKHPEAPVDFEMIDGSRVEMVYLGGYTKTTITVPADKELPTIFYGGKEIDYFDWANGGLTPDKNTHEVIVDGENNYIRVNRHEVSPDNPETYYSIDIVSDATSTESGQYFEVDYHGTYQSTSLVVADAETGAARGDLRFYSIYKTLRFPLSDLVETITSDENGIATSSELPLGDYIVRELEAPDGYVTSDLAYKFSLEYKDQFTPLIWATGDAENDAVSIQLDITKGFQKEYSSDEYEPRAGAVFGIYTYETINATGTHTGTDEISTMATPGTLVATVTTDEDGKAVETIKLPRGEYYVQEISTLEGWETNDTKFLFKVDDSVKSGALNFSYEDIGVFGKVTHSGYKTADIEISTYTQIPALDMTVNGVRYDTTEALDAETLGNQVLVENVVDPDRSTFTITAVEGAPATVEFANGTKMIVTVEETSYNVEFVDTEDAQVDVDAAVSSAISEVSDNVYRYDPMVAFTGYTAETSTIYTAPQTQLAGAEGATLAYEYDTAAGVKKAVITYPTSYNYYSNEDLPTKDVTYYRGDINMDGDITADDATILTAALDKEDPRPLTENERKVADVNKDGAITEDDLTALEQLIADLADETVSIETAETVTVEEQYLPDDAILFDTDGFGNSAYVGTVVDAEHRTMTIDLSKFDFAEGPYHVYIGDDTVVLTATGEISLESETVTATNTETGKTVTDGYQPDALTLENGNTLISKNRALKLASYNDINEVALDIQYDHKQMTMEITKGTVSTAYVSGVATEITEPLVIAPGNGVTLVMSDGAVYNIELNNNGAITMSVEDIVSGAVGENNMPRLSVNGSEDNFVDVDYQVITQTIPMDATSIDEVRQNNVKSVTLARNDSTVKQLQVKINAVDKADGNITTDPIENDRLPYISKVDATTGAELPGAKIEIYDSNGNVYASGYSNSEGKFYFQKPEPGTYTFKEVSAPAGYDLNVEIFEFTVNPDGTITGDDTIDDYPTRTPDNPGGHTPTPEMTITKVDASVGTGIAGAVIEVTDEDGNVIASGVSSASGRFTFDRPADGKYYFREVSAPEGYELNTTVYSFEVKGGKVTGDTELPNEKPYIEKVDVTTSEGIPGATIEILDEDQETVIATGESDEDGRFYFDRPEPGKYWFHETVAPDGYVLNEEMFQFEVTADGEIIGDDTITNEKTKVVISKVDVTTAEGIPGALIEVTDDEGNVIASGESDENGYFGFYRPEPGTYWFHEVDAPEGYILNEELFSFEVLEDYTIVGDNTITNVPNTIVVEKVEPWSSRPIEGATIELWDSDGKLIQVGITDSDGKVYFAVPKLGDYVYKETIAPEGYIMDEGTHVITLHADGTITGELRFTNTPEIPRTGLIDWTNILLAGAGASIALLLGVTIFSRLRKKHGTTEK